MILVVRMRTDIFVAVGRFADFSEFGKKVIPWGRIIQEPIMVAGVLALVFVGFQATTAIDRYL